MRVTLFYLLQLRVFLFQEKLENIRGCSAGMKVSVNQNENLNISTSLSSFAKSRLMDSLIKKGGQSLKYLKEGGVIESEVIKKEKGALYLDLGIGKTGIVYGREFQNASSVIKDLEPGAKVIAKIVELENEEGFVELSLKAAGEESAWENLRQEKETGKILTVKIQNANKGGLISEINGISAFLPTSQLSSVHYPKVEEGEQSKIIEALRKLIGKELRVKIIDIEPKEGKLIISEKAVKEEETKKLLAKYKVGDVVEGKITSILDFGAFMQFGKENIEGLIHISELDWQLVERPGDIVKVGQKVKAKIISIKDGRVSLSLKALKKNPWEEVAKKYKKGDIIKVKVIKFSPYGAFAEVSKNITGLIHISEFGSQKRMQERLEIGEKYDVKILLIDPEGHKIALTLYREPRQEVNEEPESKSEL